METPMQETRKGWSLSTVVTFHCVWIIALFMFLYGWMEAAIFGETPLYTLFKHTYHVALLSCALIIVLTLVLRNQVTRPVGTLNAMLYRVGAGFTDLPELRTSIRELKAVEQGIQRMRERMHMGDPGMNLAKAEEALGRLRVVAQNIQGQRPEEAQATLDSIVELSEAFGLITEKQRELE